MKLHSRNLIFIFLLLFNPVKSFSQFKDAQMWENISISKKIKRNLILHFNHEGRIANNISQFHYAYGDIGITQVLNKHFKVTLDYVLVWKRTSDRDSWRHQWYVAGMYKKVFSKKVELNIRSMYQQQYQDIYSSELGRYSQNYLRNKITFKYSFNKYPYYKVEPYLAFENYYHMDNNDKYGRGFDRNRYFAGFYYKFNKESAVEFYYLIENNFNSNQAPTNYVIGIGYEMDI